MNEQEFRNERLYQQTMSVFQRMLSEGLLTEKEYAEIDTKMSEKYCPKYGSLLSKINLIKQP